MDPVVIVGGGLAGLTCARSLHRQGIPVLVLEAEDRVGGRLKTDEFESFRLDRGFQAYCEAYPHASREVHADSLDLRKFRTGAYVFHEGALNVVDPGRPLHMLLSRFLGLRDKRKLAGWMAEVHGTSYVRARSGQDMSAIDYFREEVGFSEQAIEKFVRPLFASVFVDPELGVSARQLQFVAKALIDGGASLPALGMEAIPKQIASDLPRYLLRELSRASEILRDSSGRAVGVRLDTSERVAASAVVVATEGDEAARLTGLPAPSEHSQSVTLYFETAAPVVDQPQIVLNASGAGILHEVVPVSMVAPTYAPPGKHLIAAVALGARSEDDETLAETAKRELEEWFPTKGAYMFRFVRAYRIRYHLFAQPPNFAHHLPANATRVPGLFFAGEFTANSSIDGAVQSGRRCADLVAEELGRLVAR